MVFKLAVFKKFISTFFFHNFQYRGKVLKHFSRSADKPTSRQTCITTRWRVGDLRVRRSPWYEVLWSRPCQWPTAHADPSRRQVQGWRGPSCKQPVRSPDHHQVAQCSLYHGIFRAPVSGSWLPTAGLSHWERLLRGCAVTVLRGALHVYWGRITGRFGRCGISPYGKNAWM